jgi:anti-sigma B factor antagonist
MSDDHVFEEPAGEASSSDSSVMNATPAPSGLLQVYETGPLTVIGFGGRDVPDEVSIAAYRTELFDLVSQHHTKKIAVDLTGVRLMPSGLLGLLVSLKRRGLAVELFNASDDVLDVLHTTRLSRFFELRDVNVST